MLTRLDFQFPQAPKIEKLTENEKKLLQYVEDIKKAVAETFRTLNKPDVLTIDQATINESVVGGSTPAAGTFTDLTSTGNTVLGNASGDTLNVGNGDLIKDASGRLGLGVTPNTGWGAILKVFQISDRSAIYELGDETHIVNNAYHTGIGYNYLESEYATRIVLDDDGTIKFYTAPSGTAGNAVTFTEVFRINNDGALSALMGQVAFPATQNASADPNTLDDYEEQDVTPVLKFGGATTGITYGAVRGGKARKVGNRVEASGYFLLTSKGSATGAATIDGLPWTSGQRAAVTLYMEDVTFANQFQGFLGESSTAVELLELTEAGVNSAIADTDFANTSFVMFTVSYYA